MPVVTFRCPAGHETAIERAEVDKSLPVRCPECGATARPLVHLRGIDPRRTA